MFSRLGGPTAKAEGSGSDASRTALARKARGPAPEGVRMRAFPGRLWASAARWTFRGTKQQPLPGLNRCSALHWS